MKPWMSEKDIFELEKALLNLKKDHLDVLEWGSGGSTKHFSEFLTSKSISYSWVSIEYNKKWAEKITQLRIPNCNIILFDVGNDTLKQRNTNMDEYVNYPKTLNKKFDFILVDGRKRRRCLIEAKDILKENGLVALHDAQRTYYHCAFKYFSNASFLSKTLWAGQL